MSADDAVTTGSADPAPSGADEPRSGTGDGTAAAEEQRRASGDRGSVVDRRTGVDRRRIGRSTNLERRRGPGRRRTDFMRTAEEGEMNQEQFLFLTAIDAFKQVNGKTFPTWTDVLEVIRKLGYRKTMPSELSLGRHVEDWTEPSDAPSGVDRPSAEGDDED